MYEFKNTEGQKQSAIEQYFNRTKHNGELSINQVADYIGNVPTGVYAREPIAYAFRKVAMELGHQEPVRFNQLSFEPMRVPFDTNYIYDETLPLTMEEVRQEGVDRRYTGRFEIPMYGKVALGNRIEIGQDITEEGADEIIAIGTKPWVNVLQPSYVNKNYATTILIGDVPKEPQTVTSLDIPLELQQTAHGAGFTIDDVPFVVGQKYTISFEYQVTQGILNDISNYDLDYEGSNVYVDDELISTSGYILASRWAVGGGKHTYYMHFTPTSGTDNVFSWKFNYEEFAQPTKVWVTNLKIHEGHIHPFKEVN